MQNFQKKVGKLLKTIKDPAGRAKATKALILHQSSIMPPSTSSNSSISCPTSSERPAKSCKTSGSFSFLSSWNKAFCNCWSAVSRLQISDSGRSLKERMLLADSVVVFHLRL